jgi:putative transcriptional regulator
MESGFILYTADYHAEDQLQVSSSVRLSSNPQILHDIVLHNGPENFLFLLGYAGWGPGQLESELTDNGWLILPAEDTIIFETPDPMKWKVAAQKFGIDISTFGDVVGNA